MWYTASFTSSPEALGENRPGREGQSKRRSPLAWAARRQMPPGALASSSSNVSGPWRANISSPMTGAGTVLKTTS